MTQPRKVGRQAPGHLPKPTTQTRPPSRVVSPPQARFAPSSPEEKTPHTQEDELRERVAALETALERSRKRADASSKEAVRLRARVQELEPDLRRLEKELEKRRTRQASRSPPRLSTSDRQGKNEQQRDVALRGRLAAAEHQARVCQLRCKQLQRDGAHQSSVPISSNTTAGQERRDLSPTRAADTETVQAIEDEALTDPGREEEEARRVLQQLEVAERRVRNSQYINEAHEELAAKSAAREREASARAAEVERKLSRTLERLESIERRKMIADLSAACANDEEQIYLAQRELRAHQMDPELYLPVNTAKRRQLAGSEQLLRRLRHQLKSQAAALNEAQTVERRHKDLRRAASCGDIGKAKALLESGISVNVPDQAGLSAFLYACGQANADLVRAMIAGGGDVLDGNGRITGLIIAARQASKRTMRCTTPSHITGDIDNASQHGTSLLATYFNCVQDPSLIVLRQTQTPTAQPRYPYPIQGEVDVLQTLIDKGADLHARDSAGGSALHAAVSRGHVDAARWLMDAGADCNAVDMGTNNALHVLASSTAQGESGDATRAQLALLLLEWGASVETRNSEGHTPVSAALQARQRPLILAYREFFDVDHDSALASTLQIASDLPAEAEDRAGRGPHSKALTYKRPAASSTANTTVPGGCDDALSLLDCGKRATGGFS